MTQGEYQAVMGSNPSYFGGDLSRPVEQVSWYAATTYCAKLTERERAAKTLPVGWVYRLPTEAEWEYACRAGTTTRFSYGDDPNESQLGNYAWHYWNSGITTHAVGLKQPNAWGFYDMHGNVFEWCLDWYGTYPGGSVIDPKGPDSGSKRVIRGGSYAHGGFYCTSAFRDYHTPDYWHNTIGFRAVLDTGAVGSLVITAEPKSLAVPLGAEASFSVQTSGMPLPGCQWFFNGVEIHDATNSLLRLANVLPDFAGGYQVVASNQYDSATSQVATLTVVYDLEQPLMTNGLAAEYLLDGNVDDASGNGNHGVNLGATLASDRYGKAAGAYGFNGLTSGLYVPNSSTLDIHGKTNLTVSAWIKPAKLSPTTQAIVWKWGWEPQYALCLAKDKRRLRSGARARQ